MSALAEKGQAPSAPKDDTYIKYSLITSMQA